MYFGQVYDESIEYRVSNQIQVSINIVGIRYRTSTTWKGWLIGELSMIVGIPTDRHVNAVRAEADHVEFTVF